MKKIVRHMIKNNPGISRTLLKQRISEEIDAAIDELLDEGMHVINRYFPDESNNPEETYII